MLAAVKLTGWAIDAVVVDDTSYVVTASTGNRKQEDSVLVAFSASHTM